MKKGAVIFLVVILLAALAGSILVCTSPEFALLRTVLDVKRSGLDGLRPHLTNEAQEFLSTMEGLTDNAIIGGLLNLLPERDEGLSFLKEKLSEIKWSLEDVLRGSKQADVVIGFNYKDEITGTLPIKMERSGLTWKISGFGIPKF